MLRSIRYAGVLALFGVLVASGAHGQQAEQPFSLLNSFRIGDSGVQCTAQVALGDPRLETMFDRAYSLTCRDAASAVGTLIAVRRDLAIDSLPSQLVQDAACSVPETVEIEGIGPVRKTTCNDASARIDYRRYLVDIGRETLLVEGLAGYDPVLRLALTSVVNDRPVSGRIDVAQTEVSDAAAFARVQAGSLTDADARNEAYLRNNGGRFAEAGQFFESVVARSDPVSASRSEALANQGLQQSNLGQFQAADRLFAQSAAAIPPGDPLTPRLLRNYRAMDGLNRDNPQLSLVMLEQEMIAVESLYAEDSLENGFIDLPLSEQINRESISLQRLGGIDLVLSPQERARLLDAQAIAIAGTALRRLGRLDAADAQMRLADQRIAGVRGGNVASANWLRSEIALERALIAEGQGRLDDALAAYDISIRNIARGYPESPMLLATHARKAAFMLRTGRDEQALAMFAEVVDRSSEVPDSSAVLRDLMIPYFTALSADGSPEATAAFFAATRLLERPGVAQTQAVLARQLAEGDDEAASLFRLSLVRSREIARADARADRLAAIIEPTEEEAAALLSAQESLAYLRAEQTRMLNDLAQYPRYRSVAPSSLNLTELQATLEPGEAYYKLVTIGTNLFALWITPSDATSFPIEGDLAALERDVITVRDSIVVSESGETVVYPFEVERAYQLFLRLFGPVQERLADVEHLVFEPDGPMLQLPPQVLVTREESVSTYQARLEQPDADEYDFTGVSWLGRDLGVSIAVSPRGFMDIRRIAPSNARRAYLGLGSNALPDADQDARWADNNTDACRWNLGTWRNPIAANELYFAQGRFAAGAGDVLTGADFSDTSLMRLESLSDYRVLHFATHGLVSAPAPGCDARPALVTSFDGDESDGLLTFQEIFDLELDADVVVLSACDTAGMATVGASREAGIVTGGNYALDGLVRAFVGAGARSVVASHWPVPDDYNATQRLMEGMFGAAEGQGLTDGLAAAQRQLMDEAATSHPFYWAAFIVVGDGAKPLSIGGVQQAMLAID